MILDPLAFLVSIILYIAGAYTFYIIFLGIYNKNRLHRENFYFELKHFPYYSIIVPAKNEEKVIGRVLSKLVEQDYPKSLYEVIVVEDGSTDKTLEIAKKFEKEYENIRVVHCEESRGKPHSINIGLEHARGEVIGILDADAIPPPNMLLKASEYMQDPNIDAIQCIYQYVNGNEGILAKAGMFEGLLWHAFVLRVKDMAGLFVPLCGSGMFIKRHVFETVGKWNEKSLTEDVDFSLRMLKAGFKIRHALIPIGHETPSRLKTFFKQRVRWYRGYFVTGIRHIDVWKYLNKRLAFDISFTLLSPLLSVLATIAYFFNTLYFISAMEIVSFLSLLLGVFSYQFIYLSIAMLWILLSNIKDKMTYIMMSFFSIPYFFLLSVINMYVIFTLIFKRSMEWTKTDKTGAFDQKYFNPFS
jgi:cellulose synthase/poly-beta-1,6-N-acetylglucosamine synthase-like glycosyltransferase